MIIPWTLETQYSLCLQGLKYSDWIPGRLVIPPHKRGDVGITLKRIYWWGPNSRDVMSVEEKFITITSSFTQTRNDYTH